MSDQRPTRRTMVQGLAAGGLALPVLAACGSGTGTSGGGASAGSGSPGKGIPTSEIPVDSGKIFESDQVVVTQPTKGEFKAFSAVCTHAGCIVSSVADKEIRCACHGSAYSIVDGSVKQGPATQPLAEKKVTTKGATITVA